MSQNYVLTLSCWWCVAGSNWFVPNRKDACLWSRAWSQTRYPHLGEGTLRGTPSSLSRPCKWRRYDVYKVISLKKLSELGAKLIIEKTLPSAQCPYLRDKIERTYFSLKSRFYFTLFLTWMSIIIIKTVFLSDLESTAQRMVEIHWLASLVWRLYKCCRMRKWQKTRRRYVNYDIDLHTGDSSRDLISSWVWDHLMEADVSVPLENFFRRPSS